MTDLVGSDPSKVYDAVFYQDYLDKPAPHRLIADAVHAVLGSSGPMRVIDVGSGPGVIVQRLRELGHEAVGIEGSTHAFKAADPRVRSYLSQADLRVFVPAETYDLVCCTEVAEHLDAAYAGKLVDDLTVMAKNLVFFTAAVPGQYGLDHVHLQPHSYWIEQFAKRGFALDTDLVQKLKDHPSMVEAGNDLPWIPNNTMVFSTLRVLKLSRPGRKNLLVRSVGPQASTFPIPEDRSWDLLEIYHDLTQVQANRSVEHAVYDSDRRIRKVYIVKKLFSRERFWETYENIAMFCDDVVPAGCSLNEIFGLFAKTVYRVGQAALTPDSHVSHPITKQDPLYRWRVTNFTESMAMLFTRDALREHLPCFDLTLSGHGVDLLYSIHEMRAKGGVVILDETPVRHERPVGQNAASEHPDWSKLNSEMDEALAEYGVSRHVYQHKVLHREPLLESAPMEPAERQSIRPNERVKKLTLHLIAPFHTTLTRDLDHCAFTAKARRFSTMMKDYAHVVEYSNEGSESEAAEHVVMLSKDEYQRFYRRGEKDNLDQSAVIDGPGHRLFSERLNYNLRKRLQTASSRDNFVLHMWGSAHSRLASDLKNFCHVEIGVGHPSAPFEAFRVYESQAWRNHQWGKHENIAEKIHGTNRYYSWVIPIAYDLREWPVTPEVATERPYFLFLGRIIPDKGVYIIAHMMRAWFQKHPDDPHLFVFAGRGEFEAVRNECGDFKDRMRYIGPVHGETRRDLIANAEATLAPTKYAEPFGSTAVEGMLCGTPAITSDWGAYTETVEHGVNGFRCSLLADWIFALERVGTLDRELIAEAARDRYSFASLAPRYVRMFAQLSEFIAGNGWYSLPVA